MTPSNGSTSSETTGATAVDVEALGQSEAFLNFMDRLSQVAVVNRPVLLIGERGTGKELAAARLHYMSRRWQAPLVTLNCAALTPSLIEAELFGHERGAFTGAEQRRAGRFESADSGTLFLDEIGDIPLQVQAKILRVVEYGVFERVGGSRPVQVDVRIIGATHADLPVMVREGRFKADLLDRLAFEVLAVPTLRERVGDIDLLGDHFARKMAVELDRSEIPRFSRTARAQLQAYPWPGNVRELKNVVERAVYRSGGGLIERITLDPFASKAPIEKIIDDRPSQTALDSEEMAEHTTEGSLPGTLAAIEVRQLKQALKDSRFNQRQAALRLGISYDRLRGLMRKHKNQVD